MLMFFIDFDNTKSLINTTCSPSAFIILENALLENLLSIQVNKKPLRSKKKPNLGKIVCHQ